MKIDFRKEIDLWCGHDPEYLACDGTHIGVNIKHMYLDKPVIMPDKRGQTSPISIQEEEQEYA